MALLVGLTSAGESALNCLELLPSSEVSHEVLIFFIAPICTMWTLS